MTGAIRAPYARSGTIWQKMADSSIAFLIEAALRPLLGEPLTDMWRYADCQRFEFGPQRPAKNRRGEDITLSDKALVVGCAWRIPGPSGEVLSSADFRSDGTRRDEQAHEFYGFLRADPLLVEAVAASEVGALALQQSRGYELCVEADLPAEEDEQWRLMLGEGPTSHVTLYGRRIEWGRHEDA
jgi:hypothetical protein